jgi:pyrroline-5-carboxylate reductase
MGTRILFVGGGNMATSLVGGLLARGHQPGDLVVADPDAAQRTRLERDYRIATGPRPLVISVAAGIRLQDLARWLGPDVPLVRAMPNRPALMGAGITALYAAPGVDTAARATAAAILGACGPTVWVPDEAQMDVVTAVSGSGPAYFFLLIECLEAAGIELGLDPATARQLALETARGAGRMAAESADTPAELRLQVTSKGGTTAAALEVLEAADVRGIFARAVAAGAARSTALAREFGTA